MILYKTKSRINASRNIRPAERRRRKLLFSALAGTSTLLCAKKTSATEIGITNLQRAVTPAESKNTAAVGQRPNQTSEFSTGIYVSVVIMGLIAVYLMGSSLRKEFRRHGNKKEDE